MSLKKPGDLAKSGSDLPQTAAVDFFSKINSPSAGLSSCDSVQPALFCSFAYDQLLVRGRHDLQLDIDRRQAPPRAR